MLSGISATLLKSAPQGALYSRLGSKLAEGQGVLYLCKNNQLADTQRTKSYTSEDSRTTCSFSAQGPPPSWRSSRVSTRAMSSSVSARVIPVAVAKELLEAGHHYLDVRSPEEFAAGHAEGAVNIPYMFKKDTGMIKNEKFLSEVGEKFNKDDELVVACQSGKRSALAAAELITAEYINVADLGGGYASWTQSGLPVTK